MRLSRARVETIRTYAWMLAFALMVAGVSWLPGVLLIMSCEISPEASLAQILTALFVAIAWAVMATRTLASPRIIRPLSWRRFVAERLAETRPDDRRELREIYLGMEVTRLVEEYGWSGRHFVCYDRNGEALFFLDCEISKDDWKMREVKR